MQSTADYQRIEKAIHYLQENFQEQPRLAEVARAVHLSPFHFQRLFKRWAGISPKRFLQFLTVEHAKKALDESRSVLDASYDSGLSGPGRLHDLFVSVEAVTPGEYKGRGNGLEINWSFHPSPFGDCLLAATERGICALSFASGDKDRSLERLQRRWGKARLREDPAATAPYLEKIFEAPKPDASPLPVYLKGTNFQIKVWKALLKIPAGTVCSYRDVARMIGRPTASRAVGGAVGANPVAYLVPCHRVIRSAGDIGGYAWGTARKRALLAMEAARRFGEDG